MEIQALVDELARLIGRPITVENIDNTLIAYSAHESPVDAVRMETLLRKGASENTIEVLRKHGVYKLINSSPGVVRVEAIPEIDFNSRIALAVRLGRKVLGYLWVKDDGVPLSTKDEAAIIKTARLLSNKLCDAQHLSLEQTNSVDLLIAEILSSSGSKLGLIEYKARLHGWSLVPPFNVMVLAAKPARLSHNLKTLRQNTEEFAAQNKVEAMVGIYAGRTVAIVFGESCRRVKQIALGLSRHMEQAKLSVFIGIGCCYEELSSVSKSYQEASESIELAAGLNVLQDEPFIDYGQAALYDLVACMPECKTRGAYGRGVVHKIALYDKLNGTELLKTLEAMLDYGGKRKDAAGHLYVHPNTVDYRLRKIKQVVDFPLDDPSIRLAVHLWIKALKYHSN